MKPEMIEKLTNEMAFYEAKAQHEILKIAAIQVMLDNADPEDVAVSVTGEAYRDTLELELESTKREYARNLARRNIAANMLAL